MITRLSMLEADALKEAGSIGAASASTALSKMINRPIEVSTTKLQLMDLDDISSLVGGPTILSVGTLFEIVGDLKGALLLLASKKTTLGLADMVQGRKLGTTKFMSEMDTDAIKEIGNILVGAYMTALAELSGLNILESIPKLEINNVPTIIRDVIKEYDHRVRYTLVIETKMKIKKEGFIEDIIIILGHEEFGKLFHAMVKRMKQ